MELNKIARALKQLFLMKEVDIIGLEKAFKDNLITEIEFEIIKEYEKCLVEES